MSRAFWIDYTLPYYYLVTVRKVSEVPPFIFLSQHHEGLEATPVSDAFHRAIAAFLEASPGVAELWPYVIMPDHLHLILRIADVPGHLSLPQYVSILLRRLRAAHWAVTGYEGPIFEREWHDLAVLRPGQLKRFRHYVQANPRWARLRSKWPDRLRRFPNLRHWRLPRPMDAFGDPALLDSPILEPVRLSRRLMPGTPEWDTALEPFVRWRVGMAAVGTWYSKAEQAALRHIATHGGRLIVLSPDGLAPRWHPPEERRQLTAEGRLLTLSPYAPESAALPPGLRRERCQALNALAQSMVEALPPADPS